ncbi:MAG: hypothetical protein U9P14_07835 [Gemmatimonadota bacterium]|nr:hypothetical protein [Gemmatimonadota bacterium]
MTRFNTDHIEKVPHIRPHSRHQEKTPGGHSSLHETFNSGTAGGPGQTAFQFDPVQQDVTRPLDSGLSLIETINQKIRRIVDILMS